MARTRRSARKNNSARATTENTRAVGKPERDSDRLVQQDIAAIRKAARDILLNMDWDELAGVVARSQPLYDEMAETLGARWLGSRQAEIELREEAVAYVRTRIEAETRQFVSDALMALYFKLWFEGYVHALRRVLGDIIKLRELLRQHAHDFRHVVKLITNRWAIVSRGRTLSITPHEKAGLRKRLRREIRQLRLKRQAAGQPHANDDVLPEIARERSVSLGKLDQILYPRKPKPAKNRRK